MAAVGQTQLLIGASVRGRDAGGGRDRDPDHDLTRDNGGMEG